MRNTVPVAVVAILLLSGCVADGAPGALHESASGDLAALPTAGSFDYQLGAAYDSGDGFDVVVRDSTASRLDGAYSVCYINGFQTQPGEEEMWLDGHEDLLLHDSSGALAVDPDWPDEYILDPGSEESRAGILDVLAPTFARCIDGGFDAVEIDNLDAWTRFTDPSTGVLSEADAIALAGDYVEAAHEAGLAIAQKNAPEMSAVAHDELGFDFAIVEECAAYAECATYSDVYGDAVLQIEYTDNLIGSFDDVCASSERAPLTILRDRDLVGAGDSGYVYAQCR